MKRTAYSIEIKNKAIKMKMGGYSTIKKLWIN